MIRTSSIAAAFACLSLLPASAVSGERPLYMDSVLYLGVSGAAADSTDFSAPFDSIGSPASADTLDSRAWSDTLATPAQSPSVSLPPLHQPPLILPLASGLVMGAGLGYAAAWGGYLLDTSDGSSGEWDGVAGALTGLIVGEIIGVALGTHLGNGARGSFGRDLAISFPTGLVAITAAAYAGIPGAVLGAGFQLGTVAMIERRAAREKWSKQAAAEEH